MGKSMEKGTQSYPGQVLAAGGPRAGGKPVGGTPNVHGRDAKLPAGGTWAGL